MHSIVHTTLSVCGSDAIIHFGQCGPSKTWPDGEIYVTPTLVATWKVKCRLYFLPCQVKGSLLWHWTLIMHWSNMKVILLAVTRRTPHWLPTKTHSQLCLLEHTAKPEVSPQGLKLQISAVVDKNFISAPFSLYSFCHHSLFPLKHNTSTSSAISSWFVLPPIPATHLSVYL